MSCCWLIAVNRSRCASKCEWQSIFSFLKSGCIMPGQNSRTKCTTHILLQSMKMNGMSFVISHNLLGEHVLLLTYFYWQKNVCVQMWMTMHFYLTFCPINGCNWPTNGTRLGKITRIDSQDMKEEIGRVWHGFWPILAVWQPQICSIFFWQGPFPG